MKNIDPNQNTQAILRYVKLLEEAQIPFEAEEAIASLGPLLKEKVIEVSHEVIQSKIGMPVSQDTIISVLKSLEFGVVQEGEYLPLRCLPFALPRMSLSQRTLSRKLPVLWGIVPLFLRFLCEERQHLIRARLNVSAA